MESLAGCSSAVVTERLSTVTWGTRQPSIRVSAIQSVGVGGQSNAQLQGLYTIHNELQTIEARECPYRELKGEVLLGEGETFTVNRCDLEGKLVAVKHLKLGSWAANTPKFASRLHSVLMELRIMCYAHLRGHPNILSLLGYGWRHEHQAILPYVVVDYSPHGTFRDFLQTEGVLDIYRKKRLIQDVACGLDALHTSGIIHGDLKLDNVLIFDRAGDPKAGRVAKICDFGHSLLLSADDEDLVYRGTAIYNAPEVHKQDVKAIEKHMLPRCDIWAFGLLALEVIVDGDIYREHLQDEIYFDPTLVYDNPQIFCREVLKTAINLSARIDHPFMKIFFQGLFRRTLMLKPQARTSHLCATLPPSHPPLQVPKKWDWSFEIFHPEQAKDYSWEQQKQIFHDFELSYQRGHRNPSVSAPAAFQLGICYLVGFGVPVDRNLAQKYLSIAERSRHFVSVLINPLIQDSTGHNHHQRLYTAAVVRGLAPRGARCINLPITITSGEVSITLSRWSDFKAKFKRLEQRAWVGSISAVKSKVGGQAASSIRIGRRDIPNIELMPENWTKAPLNLLECSIMFRDVEMIETLGRWYESRVGWPGICDEWARIRSETCLIQACRTGDLQVVKALLLIGANTRDKTADGCTMLHWLFMLGPDVVDFAAERLKNINLRDLIDLPCTRARDLHKQWPFQLVGTPLAFSIWAGSVDAVTALLKLGANPAASAFGDAESLIDDVLWTHLHLAAMLHHAEILILLIAALHPKEKLRLSTSSIASVLCYSSKVERIAIHGRFTEIALERTVAALEFLDQNPLWRDDPTTECRKHSPLATAIEFNDHDVARALLKRHPHLATTPIYDSEDRSCYTYPAHLAVRVGSRHEAENSVSMLEMLFEYNNKTFYTLDSSGNSALHIAVTEYSDMIPRWLLERHQDSTLLNIIDRDGRTALHYCTSAITAELLLQRGISVDHADSFGMTSLHCASLGGASEVMQVLLRGNADINATDVTSSSALHYAVASGSSEAAHMLLSHEPNVQMQNVHGESPLHIAARRQRDDLVRALIRCGASTVLQSNHGLTPLHNAVMLETSDTRKLVELCNQESVSLCDEAGNNVVHNCAIAGRLDWLESLKRFYSTRELDALNGSGQAPIHIAAKKLDARIARHLLENQANVNVKDSLGNTAIHIALTVQEVSHAERERFCRLLISHGAALGWANLDGQTPWYLAAGLHQSEALMSMIFTLGGEQVCEGIVFHDVMLQAAFGEKSIENAVAYYDETGLHRVTQISRYQLTQISEKYTRSIDAMLPLSFQDFEKEVYIPDAHDSSDESETSIKTATSADTRDTPQSSYSNLPEAIGMQIEKVRRPWIDGLDLPEAIQRPAQSKVAKKHEQFLRGLKLAGKVTGGTILVAVLLPTAPVLLPLWVWRRRRVMQQVPDPPTYELYGDPRNIYELEASGGPYELSCFPTEKSVMAVKTEGLSSDSEAGSIYIVDPDLLEFLVEEGISRLLSFAEELQQDPHEPTTTIIEILDDSDSDSDALSDDTESIIATFGSDTDNTELSSSGSVNGDETVDSDSDSVHSTGGFSFRYGPDRISVVKKYILPSPEASECGCADCVRSSHL